MTNILSGDDFESFLDSTYVQGIANILGDDLASLQLAELRPSSSYRKLHSLAYPKVRLKFAIADATAIVKYHSLLAFAYYVHFLKCTTTTVSPREMRGGVFGLEF